MKVLPLPAIICCTLLALVPTAHADFLWASYEPETRTYRMELTDLPGRPVTEMNASQLSRIQPYTKSLRKATNGRMRFDAQTLKTAFRARQAEGVIAINGKPTLVVNHVKASALRDHFQEAGVNGFEICAAVEGERWRVWTVYQGQKIASTIFVDGKEVKAVNGEVSLPLEAKPKGFSVHSTYELPTGGMFGPDSYAAEKHRTTLVLAPTTRVSKGSNAVSYRALESALAKRESVAPTAPEAHFEFTATAGTRVIKGAVKWDRGNATVRLEPGKDELVGEIENNVRSMFSHRQDQPFWESDGMNSIRPSNPGEPAVGILVDNASKARYTLRNGIVANVERVMGDRRLILDVKNVQWLKNGKYLPKEFTRVELDASGNRRVELTYLETFMQVGVEHFPASRTVTGTANGREVSFEIVFTLVEGK